MSRIWKKWRQDVKSELRQLAQYKKSSIIKAEARSIKCKKELAAIEKQIDSVDVHCDAAIAIHNQLEKSGKRFVDTRVAKALDRRKVGHAIGLMQAYTSVEYLQYEIKPKTQWWADDWFVDLIKQADEAHMKRQVFYKRLEPLAELHDRGDIQEVIGLLMLEVI
jgi:hypothetical protein